MKNSILKLIKIYQNTISPDHGLIAFGNSRCRFHPSCSEYAYQVIKKRGIIHGIIKSIWRVLRCSPLSKGGVDLI